MAELFKVNAPVRKPLFEGVQGENEARSIQFDVTPWVEELGDGAVTATAKRSQDSQPYPVTVTKDGTTVTWKPTSTDTAFAGVGSFQLEYTVGGVLAKTCIWSTMVAPSLDPAGDPPDPYENWLAEMRQIAADAIQAAQDADESADDAQAEVYEAEAWAKGTKNGTPVSSSDAQYQNNSKYFAEESYKNAEAWAVGQRGGVDVPGTDPTYENNAKYWAGKSEELKDDTQAIVDEARADVFEAMDGLHEETTAGSALQLISDKYTENKEPYQFRKSIAGDRELDTLVGGSVAWNQLVLDDNKDYSNGESTDTRTGFYLAIQTIASPITSLVVDTVSTAKKYTKVFKTGTSALTSGIRIKHNGSVRDLNVYQNSNLSFYPSHVYFYSADFIGVDVSTADGVSIKNNQLFDLTQMFGSSVADYIYALEQATTGAGVALFRAMFPKDYYAYNTGELMSVKTTAHEMVGFNQWDEVYELGGLIWANGQPTPVNDRLRSKNFSPCAPNTQYHVFNRNAGAVSVAVFFYDASQAFISYTENVDLTTPSNAHYFKLVIQDTTTYNQDICINISSDRNGEYQPYTKHTYTLDDVELRGVMKLDGTPYFDGDTYEADGTVTRRFGIVDLGTLNYTLESTSETRQVFKTTITSARTTSSATEPFAGVSTKFVAKTINDSWVAGDMAWRRTGAPDIALVTKSGEYASAAAFKTAMSGVYLVYELATPTTETADPYTSPQIVDAYGTERYVDERTVAVPVGHVTKYPDNLREKLDGLPWDFSTLIAPTEKAYTATRNYTAGSLLIVNNVLYKATANIANGDAITPNTNVTATTLAEIISAL